MKVSVPAVRAADAAGHRRIEHQQPSRLRRGRATARAVSTSMVEQSISSVPALAVSMMPLGAEIDLAHMLAGRQHGDDDVGARGSDLRASRPACRPRLSACSAACGLTSTPST